MGKTKEKQEVALRRKRSLSGTESSPAEWLPPGRTNRSKLPRKTAPPTRASGVPTMANASGGPLQSYQIGQETTATSQAEELATLISKDSKTSATDSLENGNRPPTSISVPVSDTAPPAIASAEPLLSPEIYGGLDLSDVPKTLPLAPGPPRSNAPNAGIRYDHNFGWEASIEVNGRRRYLGAFTTADRAALIYARAMYKVEQPGFVDMYETYRNSRPSGESSTARTDNSAKKYPIHQGQDRRTYTPIMPAPDYSAEQERRRAFYDAHAAAYYAHYYYSTANAYSYYPAVSDSQPRSTKDTEKRQPSVLLGSKSETKELASLKEIVLGRRVLEGRSSRRPSKASSVAQMNARAHRPTAANTETPARAPLHPHKAVTPTTSCTTTPGHSFSEFAMQRNAAPRAERRRQPMRQLPLAKRGAPGM